MHKILTKYEQLKQGDMSFMKLRQLQYESDTWKRLLGFMREENILLKNRLSEILKDRFDKNLLEEVEAFQSKFIKKDELLVLLRDDVAELDKLLVKDKVGELQNMKDIYNKLENLRNNIINTEMQFGNLKIAFNNYLAENIN
ncbi:MAG: hypothetical protein ABI472_11260 [Ginsengibacter sp.]